MSTSYDLHGAEDAPGDQPHGAHTVEWLQGLAARFAGAAFHVPSVPRWPTKADVRHPDAPPPLATIRKLIREESAEVVDATFEEAITMRGMGALVKELCDLIFVCLWALAILGVKAGPMLAAVFLNNDLKLATGHVDPKTGKLIKAEGHPKPPMERLVSEQLAGVIDGDPR